MADPFYEPLPALGQVPWSVNGVIQEIRNRIGTLDDTISPEALQEAITDAAAVLNPVALSDAFIRDRIEQPGSFTNQALLNLFVQRGEIEINVMDYGASGTGSSSDSGAINAAISAAPEGSTVRLPANKTFLLTEQITNAGKSIHINATGAKILIDTPSDAIFFSGGFDTVYNVSSLSTTTITPNPGGKSQYAVTATLSSAVPGSWKWGDIIKLVADDVIPGSRDEGDPAVTLQGRVGEFLSFVSGSGSAATLAGTLFDPFTTNIRAARMKSNVRVSWTGGSFDFVDSRFTATPGNVFMLEALDSPVIRDVDFVRVNKMAVQLRDCRAWMVDNITIRHGRNTSDPGSLGYGVGAYGSVDGTLSNSVFSNLRHGYTNGHSFMDVAGTGVLGYGRPRDNTIIACKGESCTSAPFDSHTSGLRESFIGCKVVGSPDGFYLRGFNHLVSDATVADLTGYAVYVADEQYGGQSRGHVIDGLLATNVSQVLFIEVHNTATRPDAYTRDTGTITARNVRATSVRGRWFTCYYHTLILENWGVQFASTATTTGGASSGSNVFVRGVNLNYSGVSGAAATSVFHFFAPGGTTFATLEIRDIRVRQNASGTLANVVSGTGGSSQQLRAINVVLDTSPSGSFAQGAYSDITTTAALSYP